MIVSSRVLIAYLDPRGDHPRLWPGFFVCRPLAVRRSLQRCLALRAGRGIGVVVWRVQQ